MKNDSLHILLFGATGTIGRATALACQNAGHRVTIVTRQATTATELRGCTHHIGDVTNPDALSRIIASAPFDAVVSCLASRTGTPRDAWAIDHAAHSAILQTALAAGIPRFVQLSAICVQKPKLEFQRAKLAFETDLQRAPIRWTIIRPTAFFKSLSGQINRVKSGKPFLVFGDGQLTRCRPISDRDLGQFIAASLTDPATCGQILPIGGPGPVISPMDQVTLLERILGHPVRVKHVPLWFMDTIIGVLSLLGRISPRLADQAHLARIGRYYATESMLVWDSISETYCADQTPQFGRDTLEGYYTDFVAGKLSDDRGDHAVWS